MQKIDLDIVTQKEHLTVELNGKISIGRTSLADVVLANSELSRVHATFEQHKNGEIWLFDENSTNGSFVNGERIDANGFCVREGDEILLGNSTYVFLKARRQENKQIAQTPKPKLHTKSQKTTAGNVKLLMAASVSGLAIIFVAVVAILIANWFDNGRANEKNAKVVQSQSSEIPVAVVDPLKGDPEEIDDLLALFAETQEEDLSGADLEDVKTAAADETGAPDLNVTIAFWEEQKRKSLAARDQPIGLDPPGTIVPPELFGDGVVKQKAKLAELIQNNYQQPMDFADLAQKRINKELVELPMATQNFYLEVGSSASEEPFSSFSFAEGNSPILIGTPKYRSLLQLAGVFASSLENSRERKQMRIRLLRMFHPLARGILDELATAYRQKFDRPLRVTSLTRSMDYQIALNKVNPNSFKVRGAGSLPPHTSGCAFDLARKHMSAEEQNFVMAKLAEMERRGVLDALREGGANACFHVFIYPDGKPPK